MEIEHRETKLEDGGVRIETRPAYWSVIDIGGFLESRHRDLLPVKRVEGEVLVKSMILAYGAIDLGERVLGLIASGANLAAIKEFAEREVSRHRENLPVEDPQHAGLQTRGESPLAPAIKLILSLRAIDEQ